MKTPTARKLPSGSWFCRVTINGTVHCITANTKTEAEREALRLKSGAKKKLPTSMTLSEALDAYINDRSAVLSVSTVRGYRIIARTRFSRYQALRLSKLDCRMCQRMVNDEARIVSPKTLKNAWGLVSSAIRYTTGEEITVHLPQVVQPDLPWLDSEQIKSFLTAIRDTRNEIPALIALHSVTRSELYGMTFANIHDGIIYVRGATVRDEYNEMTYQEANKTTVRRRDIPILIPRLAELCEGKSPSDPVTDANPEALGRSISRLCKRHNLPEVGLHGLRRTFASLCWELGIDAKTTRELGGWSNDQTVLKIYAKLSRSHKEKQVDKIKQFFK